MKFETISWMICACFSFCISRFRVKSASIRTFSRSLRSSFRNWRARNQNYEIKVLCTFTYFEFHRNFLLCQHFAYCTSRPWLKMKSLQQRCTPTTFSFQAPIPAHEVNEVNLLPNGHLSDVIHDVAHYYSWNKRWSELIRLRVCACLLRSSRRLQIRCVIDLEG